MNPNHTFYIHRRDNSISLDGEWKFALLPENCDELPTEFPYRAVLPSSGFRCLEQAGLKPDPYYGTNSSGYLGVEDQRWFFYREFSVPESDADAVLCFDGVCYICRVYINGSFVCEHEGMFGGPVVNVNEYIHPGNNSILVEVTAPHPRNSEQHRHEIVPWYVVRDTDSSNGEFLVFGIWRSVRLELLPKRRLARPYLYTRTISGEKAVLRLSCELVDEQIDELEVLPNDTGGFPGYSSSFVNGLDARPTGDTFNISVRLTERTTGKTVYECTDTVPVYDKNFIAPGTTWKECQFYEKDIEISNPLLWWPNGLGNAELYDVDLFLTSGNSSDHLRFAAGIRTLSFDFSAGMRFRSRWEKFRFIVNGRPFFVKGMNFMPVDHLYDIRESELRWTLELAANCGIQVIRVWSGGGMPEDDRFYDICDELGMLVIQDNLLANNTSEYWDPDVLESQVCQNLYRIRCHPSLALHTGGNEINPYARGNLASMSVISREIEDLDPSRVFWRTTPDRGSAHIYRDMEPVWYRKSYSQLPFIGESGIHSFPNYKSLRQLIPAEEFEKSLSDVFSEDFSKQNPALRNHFSEYHPARIPRMLARASMISDINGISLPDLCEATQLASCEFYQIMIQAMRENYPVNCGVLPWVFRRPMTTVAIQLVDGLGDPIAPYYYVKNAYSPLSVFLALEEVTYAPGETLSPMLCVVNDGKAGYEDLSVLYEIIAPDMSVVLSQSVQCASEPDDYMKKYETCPFVLPESFTEKYFFFRVRAFSGDDTVSSCFYWCKVLERFRDPEALKKWRAEAEPNICFTEGPWLKPQICSTAKQSLEAAVLDRKDEKINGERHLLLSIRIRNAGERIVFPVKIDSLQDRTMVMAQDNCFALDPDSERIISLNVRVTDPDACSVTLEVSAWNSGSVTMNFDI